METPVTESQASQKNGHSKVPVMAQSDIKPVPALTQITDKPKQRSKAWLIVGGLGAAIAVIIGLYWVLTKGKESTDDAQIEADVAPIAARVSGSVARVLVHDDQLVKQGEVLLELDASELEARLASAQAEKETAEAQAAAADAQVLVAAAGARGGLTSAQAMFSGSAVSVASAKAQVSAAKANVVRTEAAAHKAKIDLDRARQLREGNVVPQANLDAAQASFDEAEAGLSQARAQVDAAEEALLLSKSHVGEAAGSLARSSTVKPQIAAVQAQAKLAHAHVKSAEAALQLAQLNLNWTKVTAPAAGMVSRLTARVGQQLSPGQPVAELVPQESYIVANFKETQIGGMKPGQRALVEIDAFGGKKLEAKVESIAGGTGARFALLPPDNATGNFVKVVQRVPVRLRWAAPPDVPLRAGLSADVTVYVQ